ncbi:MAG: DNA-directed DNA polymerase II small subunit [Candidatus Woesearchaeota archaeon]
MEEKKDIINFFLQRNILLNDEVVDHLINKDLDEIYNKIQNMIKNDNFLVLNNELLNIVENNQEIDVNWNEFDKAKVLKEKEKNLELYSKFLEILEEDKHVKDLDAVENIDDDTSVKVTYNYNEPEKKREMNDFVAYFNNRYNQIEKLFQGRQDLQSLVSINRVLNKKEKENISLICIIKEKRTTKNGNIVMEVEDPTGTINILVNKNKPDLFKMAQNLVLDEVIAINGANSDRIIFVNSIYHPDIPLNREIKKCKDESYALILSDLHVGSNFFLEDKFNKFLKWINSEVGNESQKIIAKLTKYIFIVGDLVDGVGIYPGQEKELKIQDIYIQYDSCAELLQKIPKDKKIIICPGNHDSIRISEPQPQISKEFTKKLWDMDNVIMVSNPSTVNIHSSDDFNGFDVLMYHGYSFDYYVANVDDIRNQGGYDRSDLIMKFLLQRRHLAPTHTSTLYIPEVREDPLVINKIPDFFITGHVHKSSVSNYKNVTLIGGSCFQTKTPFQEKVGHNPEPGKVPIINLKTREIKVLKF